MLYFCEIMTTELKRGCRLAVVGQGHCNAESACLLMDHKTTLPPNNTLHVAAHTAAEPEGGGLDSRSRSLPSASRLSGTFPGYFERNMVARCISGKLRVTLQLGLLRIACVHRCSTKTNLHRRRPTTTVCANSGGLLSLSCAWIGGPS